MTFLTVLLIAVALSADIVAVSLASGICLKKPKVNQIFKISFFVGMSHILMLFIGWYGGQNFKGLISSVDHWIAFGLLCFIGLKMLFETLKPEHQKNITDLTNTKMLLLIAFATSIDALAVGISFSILKVSIIMACATVGTTTFVLSFISVLAGRKLGATFGKKAEIIGAIILIAIGIKILFE